MGKGKKSKAASSKGVTGTNANKTVATEPETEVTAMEEISSTGEDKLTKTDEQTDIGQLETISREGEAPPCVDVVESRQESFPETHTETSVGDTKAENSIDIAIGVEPNHNFNLDTIELADVEHATAEMPPVISEVNHAKQAPVTTLPAANATCAAETDGYRVVDEATRTSDLTEDGDEDPRGAGKGTDPAGATDTTDNNAGDTTTTAASDTAENEPKPATEESYFTCLSSIKFGWW